MRDWMKVLVPPILTLIVIVAAWEIITRTFHVKPYIVPPPSRVWQSAVNQRELLWKATLNTTKSAVVGFAISTIIGILTAILLITSRWVERALYPFTVFLQTVPLVAIAPLLVLWLGAGLRAVTISAAIVSIFPVIANTFNGLRSVDPALTDLFRLYGASRFATLMKLKLPSALPSIFTGLRVAAGLAVIGTIVGEFVAGTYSDEGLGIEVQAFNRNNRTDVVFACVILASLLGLVMFALVNFVSYLMLRRWHASSKNA